MRIDKYYDFPSPKDLILIWFTDITRARFCKKHFFDTDKDIDSQHNDQNSLHLSPWKRKSANHAHNKSYTILYLHRSRFGEKCLTSWSSLCSSRAPRGWNVMLPEGWSPRRSLKRVDWGRRVLGWTSRVRVLSYRRSEGERESWEPRSLSRESLSSCKGIWMSQCINEAISSLIHKGFVNVCALSAKFFAS